MKTRISNQNRGNAAKKRVGSKFGNVAYESRDPDDRCRARESHNSDGDSVSPEAVEFGKAVEAWKKKHNCRYPSLSDLLHVLRSIGYRKIEKPDSETNGGT